MYYQVTVSNAIVLHKKANKIYKFFVLQVAFCLLKVVGTVFVSSIISSNVT